MGFFLGLGALVVVWLGSREVIAGRITVGQFVAFNAYLTMLSWPMIAFGWVTNMLQRGMASWKRMLEVLDTEPAIADRGPRIADVGLRSDQSTPAIRGQSAVRNPSPQYRGAIEFRDLVFAYGETVVLNHVSATIEAGQTVALVGVTGSGKSTLISLLARLHDPPPGTVFVDGVDVRDIPLATLRSAIGFVPQEPFLFSDTLADNVAFGLDGREGQDGNGSGEGSSGAYPDGVGRAERRIETAAAVARLDKDVADFPKGYETMVGERGITLSGGQKQRTALARADRHRSADPDPGRCALGRGYLHRGRNSVAAARRDARAHLDHRFAPHLDRPRCRRDLRARQRPDRRARHARGAGETERPVRGAARKQLLEEELAAS